MLGSLRISSLSVYVAMGGRIKPAVISFYHGMSEMVSRWLVSKILSIRSSPVPVEIRVFFLLPPSPQKVFLKYIYAILVT